MIVTKETSDKCWLEEPQQRQCYGPTGRYECEDKSGTPKYAAVMSRELS